jgi:ferredoxin-type protein NapH
MSHGPVRHLEKPRSASEWFVRFRFTILRRIVQFLILALFIGSFRWGWAYFGFPVLEGDLSTSHAFGLIPLADPFAALQRFAAQWWLSPETLIGSAVVLAFYILVSGRTFCAWVCPMNLVTDAAAWVRDRLGIKTEFVHFPGWTRYVFLVLSLIVSVTSGVAAFEAVSPQAFIWRQAVYGVGLGFISAVFGVFAFDLAVSKRGWCGHLCPLGAFWACVGTVGQIRVGYDGKTCTRCGDCLKVCPEPQVLNFKKAGERGMVASGECTNCGKCVAICPEESLKFILRTQASKTNNPK